MKVNDAFKKGLAFVAENYKIIPILYMANFLLAIIIAIPRFAQLDAKICQFGVREDLQQNFDYEWWTTFNHTAKGIEKTVKPSLSGGFGPLFDNLSLFLTGRFDQIGTWIFCFAAAYLILAAFFNGGIIGLFADEKRSFSTSRFFSYSGLYFHHFFALALTAVSLFFLIYKFIHPAIFNLVDSITLNFMSQPAAWFVNFAAYFLLLILIILLNIIFDYAKIIIVSEKKESSWLCIWLAIRFIAMHFASGVGLYLLVALLAIGLVIVFGFLLNVINPSQIALFIIAILLQQIFIFAKIAIRLTFYGTQFAFYQKEHAAVRKLKKV